MQARETQADLELLEVIQRRVLWLAINMIEFANHRRPNPDGLKVGGHQASCASMVTLMTALYLHHLDADDFVAVKPHGSPVLHAIQYLLGNLDRSKLESLRELGGLQAYPSRTKDPDRVDFSTGSVGLGPAATIFAAGVRGYVESHFGARPRSRFVAVLGDAELDEGNVWEAVHDPATTSLGSVTWLVDFNRQSLDRIVPDMRISPWHAAFAAHGWQVIEVKYGHRFREFVSTHEGGEVIFAYTHKGYGLPIQGNARNHAAVLSTERVVQLRDSLGITAEGEWDRFDADSAAGRLLAERAGRLRRTASEPGGVPAVPSATSLTWSRPLSTQEAFGHLLVELSRDKELRPYLVTSSPDVATSTNLAGWINRVGVFAPVERKTWSQDALLRWTEHPRGQHIELGISEMNLFLLLGQLGLSQSFSGQRLLPIGTLYDPFVARGLDALIYGVYSGASFVFAGTPSGITLAPEGGAHQSLVTASIGTELPGITYHEPAYAQALDWLLCDALARVAGSDDLHAESTYLRLTTRQLSQQPFEEAVARVGRESLRRQVLQGAYRLREAAAPEGTSGFVEAAGPRVVLAACGAVLPEVLAAADELGAEGVFVDVVDVTSPGRLYRAWREAQVSGIRTARVPDLPGALRACFPHRAPIVTIQDASSHNLAWLGSALGVPTSSLGVDDFGQSGSVTDLYARHQLDSGSIVNAALGVLGL